MSDLNLSSLSNIPTTHADLIRAMAAQCTADERIQAIWIGGSLAAGTGDAYSDIDFRIAVEPGQLDPWLTPDWQRYLPIQPCGAVLLRFGGPTLLHHLVLTDGTIVDFFVQDTTHHNHEPNIVILTCRNAAFQEKLESFTRPADALLREIDGAVVRQFLVDYWITTHKQMKALARHYDYTAFAGLYLERMALLRAWFMQAAGKDIDARPTLHMIGALHKGLAGQLSQQQHDILGLPSCTTEETIVVIEAIRVEMARVGRLFADRHGFAYPHELEAMVLRVWDEQKRLHFHR